MGLFSSSTAKSEVKVQHTEFVGMVQGHALYGSLKGMIGPEAQTFAVALFDYEARKKNAEGFWAPGASSAAGGFDPNAGIRLKSPADRSGLADFISEHLKLETSKVPARKAILAGYDTSAGQGKLRIELNANTEPERNYYTTPATVGVNVKASIARWEAKSPKPEEQRQRMETARAKATQWLAKPAVEKNYDPKPYHDVMATSASTAGGWPFGSDVAVLTQIWKTLTTEGERAAYRLNNPINPSAYPSSISGRALLAERMKVLASRPMPPFGDARWYDLAVCLFGTLMAAQAFPDGNKRVARAAYAILMARSGLDFRAPTDKYGARLAAMK